MIALFVQTLLLMGAAYFVGAAVACLVRRSFHAAARPQPAVARPVEPLPDMGGPARFGRSSEGGARPTPQRPPRPPTAPAAPLRLVCYASRCPLLENEQPLAVVDIGVNLAD